MKKKKAKETIIKLIPPIIIDIYHFLSKPSSQPIYGWFGDYESWDVASQQCSGYDSAIILDKVKSALLKVKNLKAAFERDSVVFDQLEYHWPLLASLLRIGLEKKGKLQILDFGGSLGSIYFQSKDFLSVINDIQWNIVEQKHFVDVGKELFEDNQLKFHYSIDECFEKTECNILLLAGVLQYLKSPIDFVENIIKYCFDYIIIDRTSFINEDKSRITIQKVDPEIYEANYPCWFLNEKELITRFDDIYDQISCFYCNDNTNIVGGYFKGFIFKKKYSIK